MNGMYGGGFSSSNMMTPAQKSAQMAKEAAEKRKALHAAQRNNQQYGTQDPLLIGMQQYQAMLHQQAMRDKQQRGQQAQSQASGSIQQKALEAAEMERRRRMGQTLHGRNMLQRGFRR